MRLLKGAGRWHRVPQVSLALVAGVALGLVATGINLEDEAIAGGVPPTTVTTAPPPTSTSTTTSSTSTSTSTSTSSTTTSTVADKAAPETAITKSPPAKVKTKRRRAKVRYAFSSSEPGSSFVCAVDARPFSPCASPHKVRLRKGKHTLAVQAIDGAGNADASPATAKVKVKRKQRR
jgi:hypothetical protein